jgi:hypothetical protein
MTLNFIKNLNTSPEKKREFILNAIRFISLFMLILGYVLIMYFVLID